MAPIDQITLRNRLLVATAMWKETIAEPLPRMPPGDPGDQIQNFEITLVDRLWQSATAESAREIADRTWDLVHDRPDNDPVKRRVVECHEALARLTRLGDWVHRRPGPSAPAVSGRGPSAERALGGPVGVQRRRA